MVVFHVYVDDVDVVYVARVDGVMGEGDNVVHVVDADVDADPGRGDWTNAHSHRA